MKQIAQVMLFDRNRRLLIYLRDDKPEIPFPNHWDFFGGHLEAGESQEQALVRELKEELAIELTQSQFVRRYECLEGDAYPNVKFIYRASIDQAAEELVLYEGQKLKGITIDERLNHKFANILGRILEDYIVAGLSPAAVDNSSAKIPPN